MKNSFLLITMSLALSVAAQAHNAICDCFDNADGTITCEGGFSDGSPAVGIALRVVDGTGKVLVEGEMGAQSDFTFAKPEIGYRVQFDAGEGHIIQIDGRDIEE